MFRHDLKEGTLLYVCDPQKNTSCSKMFCQKECRMTSEKQYSVQQSKEVREMWEEFVECIKENWIALVASAVTAAITTVLFRLLLAMLLG